MLDSPDLFEAQTHSGNHFLSAQIPNKEEIKDDESEASFLSAQSFIKKEIQDDESEASVAAGEYIKDVTFAEAMKSLPLKTFVIDGVACQLPYQAEPEAMVSESSESEASLSDSKDSGFRVS